jgi:hypothetical protein
VGGGDTKVAVTTLDACTGRYPTATLLLMDVENFAAEILRGAYDLLKKGTPILCEPHNTEERDGVLSRLSAAG